jgi:hypothetical protein
MINIIFQDGIGSSLRASATAVQGHGRSAASHRGRTGSQSALSRLPTDLPNEGDA